VLKAFLWQTREVYAHTLGQCYSCNKHSVHSGPTGAGLICEVYDAGAQTLTTWPCSALLHVVLATMEAATGHKLVL
jgi:hypothetical protein